MTCISTIALFAALVSDPPTHSPTPVWLEPSAKFDCKAFFRSGDKSGTFPLRIATRREQGLLALEASASAEKNSFPVPKPVRYKLDTHGVPEAPVVNAPEELYLFFLIVASLPPPPPKDGPVRIKWEYPGARFDGECRIDRTAEPAFRVRWSGAAKLGDTESALSSTAYYDLTNAKFLRGECELRLKDGTTTGLEVSRAKKQAKTVSVL